MRENNKKEVNKTTIKIRDSSESDAADASPGSDHVGGTSCRKGANLGWRRFFGALGVLGRVIPRRKTLAGFSLPSLGWHSTWREFKNTMVPSLRLFGNACEILCVLRVFL